CITRAAMARGRRLKGSGVRNNGVGSWIARRARRTPDRVAVIHRDDRLTYAQLHDRVTGLLIEPGFEPGRALDLIEGHRVPWLFGVPAVYDAIAAPPRWAGADLSSLRVLLCGGAPVPEATIRGYTSRGLTFIQGYGMTETSPGALLLDAGHVESKAGSAGVPHFFTDVRVVRPDLTPAPA